MDAFNYEWGGNDSRNQLQDGGTTLKAIASIRKVFIERRYHVNSPGTKFFFERNQISEVYSLSLKRKTLLIGFLAIISQIAMIDTMNILPCGLLLFAIEIPYAVELISSPWDEDEDIIDFSNWINNLFGFVVDIQEQQEDRFEVVKRQRDEFIRNKIRAAQFEYHVLRGRPNVRIVPVQNKAGIVSIIAYDGKLERSGQHHPPIAHLGVVSYPVAGS